MNKKGFTLVELIVAITILGIVTALAFSGGRRLLEQNRNSKFEEYGKTMIEAAKIYVDSYDVDMFTELNKCYKLKLGEHLIAKDLIKDFPQNGFSCNNDGTFVNVYKESGRKYVYSLSLKCTDEAKGGAIIYQNGDGIIKDKTGGTVLCS